MLQHCVDTHMGLICPDTVRGINARKSSHVYACRCTPFPPPPSQHKLFYCNMIMAHFVWKEVVRHVLKYLHL